MTTALITGASAGLGEEFAMQLAATGHDLVLVARDHHQLERVGAQARAQHGVRVRVLRADLTTQTGRRAVAERLRLGDPDQPRPDATSAAAAGGVAGVDDGLGPVDLLVANAGMGLPTSFVDGDVQSQLAMLELLTAGVLEPAHAAAASMRARGRGAIIVVASVAAFIPGGTYAAAKAWALSFAESLAGELAGSGVTVTALCPGFTRTQFHARADLEVSALPGWVWLSARRVVAGGLADARAGRVVSVPSLRYRALVGVLAILPRSWVRALIGGRRAGTGSPRR